MIELDDDQCFNILNRMDKQKYNSKLKADTALAQAAVNERTNDAAPVTIEPPTTPTVDIEEQMIFQEKFIEAIEAKDTSALSKYIKQAARSNYSDQMEKLICWAEHII